jgi:glycosyltransferase involved in cell wall biosynthesis
MKTLSVVLATFNEEGNIRGCLQSVKDLADEIVIADGGSTDKTLEVIKEFNAKVITTDNPKNFHINKNLAIDAATKDWVLQLDADERVSAKLEEEIKKVINSSSDISGYWVPRSNYFLGRFLKKGGQYPDYTMRLYKKGKGRLPAKDVHEQAEVDGKIGYLKHDLLHLRDKTFKKYLSGLDRYTTFIALQMKQGEIKLGLFSPINYLVIKPIFWFFWTQIRHKGILDGIQGIIFSFFSALRFPISYIKFLLGGNK